MKMFLIWAHVSDGAKIVSSVCIYTIVCLHFPTESIWFLRHSELEWWANQRLRNEVSPSVTSYYVRLWVLFPR